MTTVAYIMYSNAGVFATIYFFNFFKFISGDPISNFIEKTAENGYTSEEHTVTTEDGYILTIFRMYKGEQSQISNKTTPILLIHGLFQDSNCWIDSGPDAGLAYNLSAAGYDTWIGNTRGNLLASKHVSLNSDVDTKYWEYSADEIGHYDIPAMIDYILNTTNTKKLNCITFSQSGTGGLIAFSERQEYCQKVGVFIALSPAAKLVNSKPFLKTILEDIAKSERILNKLGIYTAFKNNSLYQQVNQRLSSFFLTSQATCRTFIGLVDNAHPGSVTGSTFENICPHFPAPTAIRVLAGYGQSSISGKFQKYDFGTSKNQKVYGSNEPPEYNVTSVCVPIVILQGANDPEVNQTDTKWLASQLPKLKEFYVIDDPLWTHVDMTYSQYCKDSLYPKMHEYLSKYTD